MSVEVADNHLLNLRGKPRDSAPDGYTDSGLREGVLQRLQQPTTNKAAGTGDKKG
ncbi:hypothetical protein GCM10022265_24320 [Marinobacter xestospongiae]